MSLKVSVVKVGGAILEDSSRKDVFLQNFLRLPSPKILIHGGGVLANKLAKDLSVPVKMIEGRRVTDKAMLDIVTMVYGGKISKDLAAYLSSRSCPAVGLTGADMMLVKSKKRPSAPIDYGYVGDVEGVNFQALKFFLDAGICPIMAPLSCDQEGTILNTNADTIAANISKSLAMNHYESILYLTMDLDGVRTDLQDPQSLLSQINMESYQKLMEDGTISGGMIPKLDNAFSAKRLGASRVFICKPEALNFESGEVPWPSTEIFM